MFRLSPRAGALAYRARADVALGAEQRDLFCSLGRGREPSGQFSPATCAPADMGGKGKFAVRAATRKGNVYPVIPKMTCAEAGRVKVA